MEGIAFKIKELVIIFVLLLFINPLLAQTIPKFSTINPSDNKKLNLHAFLGSFNHLPMDDCLKATGTIKFKLDRRNKIDIMAVSGNLPDTLVNTLKNRIKATEGHWSTNINDSVDYERWFVLPVFVDRQSRKNCAVNKIVSNDLKILTELFRERSDIIVTATSYLLYPFDISSIY